MKAEAKKAIEAGVDLLEPGCGIAPLTPLVNVKVFVEAAKNSERKVVEVNLNVSLFS